MEMEGEAVPRLTDARRELRRAQIAEAAIRCFSRTGPERTSIADITAESGLSAGSIYTHYRNKTDLTRAAAREVLAKRAATIGPHATAEHPPDPDELLARLVAAIDPAEARVTVQAWGESTTDPVIRDAVTEVIDRIRGMLHDCVTAWLVRVERVEPTAARERAAPIAHRVLALFQAEMLSTALRTPPKETPP